MEKKVLEKKELENLKQIRVDFDNFTAVMGQIETQITLLNLEKNEVIEGIKELKKQEIQLGNELKVKYGDGNISLETGEFISYSNKELSSNPV
tara:strand:- start:776 stop:1054 length:279 start_codon:yes stop_codon:yes gene_type:complete